MSIHTTPGIQFLGDTEPDGLQQVVRPPASSGALARLLKELQGQVDAARQVANTVTVFPGQATFSTISDALASISDAGPDRPYTVVAGPGTYQERVALIPWANLQGAGPGVTIISCAQGLSQGRGIVHGAANSGIGDLTVTGTNANFGAWLVGVSCNNAPSFVISNVDIQLSNGNGGGTNIRGIELDVLARPHTPPTILVMLKSNVTIKTDNESAAVGLIAWNSAIVRGSTDCRFAGAGTGVYAGARSLSQSDGTPMTFRNGSISASNYSVYNANTRAVTLIDTTLSGSTHGNVVTSGDQTEDAARAKTNRSAVAQGIARAWSDPDYRSQLLADPKAALAGLGLQLDDQLELLAHADAGTVRHVVVPAEGLDDETWTRARLAIERGYRDHPDVEFRLLRNTASTRHLVVPQPPEGMTATQLARPDAVLAGGSIATYHDAAQTTEVVTTAVGASEVAVAQFVAVAIAVVPTFIT